jgi:hypothetical protein
VCALSGSRGFLELPESRVVGEREFISGAERALYEVAVAGAALGLDVELRGAICGPILSQLTRAAGAHPAVGLSERPPVASDLVILPETADRDLIAAVVLSAAKGVVMMLAPPGLYGSSLHTDWERPDPLTVDPNDVGRPESFAAWGKLGLDFWTDAHGLVDAARAGGVEMEWIGTGTPVAPLEPVDKTADVAVVVANRWAAPADEVIRRLAGLSVLKVPPTGSVYSLAPALAPSKTLLWPARVEGLSRMIREAQSVGTVPIVLGGNPYVTTEDLGEGVVMVADLDAMVATTSELLADPARLEALSQAGRRSAAAQTVWEPFLRRVHRAVYSAAAAPTLDGGDWMGREMWAAFTDYRREEDGRRAELEDRVFELGREAEDCMRVKEAMEQRALQAETRVAHLEEAILAAKQERDSAVKLLAASAGKAELAEAFQCELEVVTAELEAYRSRRVVRMVDGWSVGRALGAARSWTRGALE